MDKHEWNFHPHYGLEEGVVFEINKARENPEILVNMLEEMVKSFKGDKYIHPKFGSITYTNGVNILKTAIDFIKKEKPVGKLIRDIRLDRVARNEHIRMYKIHTNSRMDTITKIQQRITNIEETFNGFSESFSLGFPKPKEIIKDMLLHEFAINPHAINMLTSNFTKIGVYTNKYPKSQLCTVLTFMGNDYHYKPDKKITVTKYDLPYGDFPAEYKSLTREYTYLKISEVENVSINYTFTLPNDNTINIKRMFVDKKLVNEESNNN